MRLLLKLSVKRNGKKIIFLHQNNPNHFSNTIGTQHLNVEEALGEANAHRQRIYYKLMLYCQTSQIYSTNTSFWNQNPKISSNNHTPHQSQLIHNGKSHNKRKRNHFKNPRSLPAKKCKVATFISPTAFVDFVPKISEFKNNRKGTKVERIRPSFDATNFEAVFPLSDEKFLPPFSAIAGARARAQRRAISPSKT